MAKLDDYKDLWGEDFGELVKLFRAGVTPELENLLVGIVDSMVFDARSFALNIEKSVANMAQTGMSMNLIEDVLTEDMQTGGKIFGQLRNNINETTAKAINQSSRLGQYSTYFADPELLMDSPSESKPMKFMWVTVAGHKVCRDCISRSGRIKTRGVHNRVKVNLSSQHRAPTQRTTQSTFSEALTTAPASCC